MTTRNKEAEEVAKTFSSLLAERIKVALTVRDMSRTTLATILGMKFQELNLALDHKEVFGIGSAELIKISNTLDIELDWFMSDDPAYVGLLITTGKVPSARSYYKKEEETMAKMSHTDKLACIQACL